MLSLISGATAFVIAAPTAFAQSAASEKDTKAEGNTQKLEAFEVTGSRIKRLDAETPSPVVVYQSEAVEQKGYTNLGEFIQSLPFNTGSANSIFQSASFTRGAVTANPRGLGSNRFLTLINGRRAVAYALTQGNNNSIFDFSSIPTSAVERIEYLKDGASAIYGSDAITGVLNVILKRNFSGVEADLYVANTTGHDNLRKQASVITGTTNGKTSMEVIFNYSGMNSSDLKDYSRSKSVDYSYLGAKGLNLEGTSNDPANVTFSIAQAAAAGLTGGAGFYVISGGARTANPSVGQFVNVGSSGKTPNENRYDFAKSLQVFPDQDTYSVYSRIEHQFTDSIKGYSEITYSNAVTKYAFTPFPVTSTSNPGTGPTGLLNIPPTNPYNPFGINITNFNYQGVYGPKRLFDIDSTAANFLFGLKGDVGDNWSWDTAFAYGYNLVSNTNRNAVRADVFQAALNGTTRQTALNPFGPSDNPDVVKNLYTISNGSARDTAYVYDLSVQGKLIEMPGVFGRPSPGSIGLAIGGEWRREKLDTRPDTQAYLGSGGGLPLSGSRRVYSGYIEFDLPLVKELEVQLAGRHESYSDFGKTDKPKVGVKLTLPKNDYLNVVLRGSYSKSFKAPDLGRLYATQTTAFSSSALADPLRPNDAPTQIKSITGGNPKLKPENGEIYYWGAVFESPKIKDLTVSIDYLQIKIKNVINTPSVTFLLSPQGQAQFPSAIIRDNSQGFPGPILYISAIPINAAEQDYQGFDFSVDYKIRDTMIGTFGFDVQATYITSIATDSGFGGGKFQNRGRYNNPRLRGTATATWNYKNFGASIATDYIGEYFNDGFTVAGWGENQVTVITPSVSYKAPWNTTVRAGVVNVFNRQPPVNGYTSFNWDQNTYGENVGGGRLFFLEVKKAF